MKDAVPSLEFVVNDGGANFSVGKWIFLYYNNALLY